MTAPEKSRSNSREFLGSLLPIITWLPSHERAWLRADIMAGLAVWAMTVPQALAYAGIAGVPPVYGLYAVPLAMGDPNEFLALTSLLALLVGALFLLFGLLRLGWVANFLSQRYFRASPRALL